MNWKGGHFFPYFGIAVGVSCLMQFARRLLYPMKWQKRIRQGWKPAGASKHSFGHTFLVVGSLLPLNQAWPFVFWPLMHEIRWQKKMWRKGYKNMEKQPSRTIVIVLDHRGAALLSPKCLFVRLRVFLATGVPVLLCGRSAFVGGGIKHSF